MLLLATEIRPAPPHTFPAAQSALHSGLRRPKRGVGRSQNHQRPPSTAFPLEKLSLELLCILLEHLNNLDYTSLLSLRLVSKQFDQLSTQAAYFNLHVNERLLELLQDENTPGLANHINRFTRHIHLRSNLDQLHVASLMRCTRKLCSVHYYYVAGDSLWLPAQILDDATLQRDHSRLYVHGLPIRQSQSEALPENYLESIPTDSLKSLKLAAPALPLTSSLDPLRQLLLRTPKLESFHYRERGQGATFQFKRGEKLPAVKDLLLQSYQWTHSATAVEQHWQLSNLTSLQLIDVSLLRFLNSVRFEDLAGVTRLVFEDNIAHMDEDNREQAAELMGELIHSHITSLKSLELTCSMPSLRMESILQHSKTIEHLKLRDHTGFEEDGNFCPSIHPESLAILSTSLSSVTSLELDMDTTLCDPVAFLHAVSGFPKLQDLTLHVQTVLTSYEETPLDQDRDYGAAISTLKLISQRREQLRSSLLRKLTVNVGGWRPVMIRRISAAWKKKNEDGIFAERCFTFERKALCEEFTMTEETCSEPPTSCKNVPDLPEAIGIWSCCNETI